MWAFSIASLLMFAPSFGNGWNFYRMILKFLHLSDWSSLQRGKISPSLQTRPKLTARDATSGESGKYVWTLIEIAGFMLIWLHFIFSGQLLLFAQKDFWESKVIAFIEFVTWFHSRSSLSETMLRFARQTDPDLLLFSRARFRAEKSSFIRPFAYDTQSGLSFLWPHGYILYFRGLAWSYFVLE